MTLVPGSSATLAWATSDEVAPAVQDVFDRVVATHAVVPASWRLEVANGLHMGVRRGRLDAAERDAALADLAVLDIRTDADTDTHAWSGAVRLAERFGLTVHDACTLEPAGRRALPLASLDGNLRAAADACGVPPGVVGPLHRPSASIASEIFARSVQPSRNPDSVALLSRRTNGAWEGPMRYDQSLPDCLRCTELHDFSDMPRLRRRAAHAPHLKKGMAVALSVVVGFLFLAV